MMKFLFFLRKEQSFDSISFMEEISGREPTKENIVIIISFFIILLIGAYLGDFYFNSVFYRYFNVSESKYVTLKTIFSSFRKKSYSSAFSDIRKYFKLKLGFFINIIIFLVSLRALVKYIEINGKTEYFYELIFLLIFLVLNYYIICFCKRYTINFHKFFKNFKNFGIKFKYKNARRILDILVICFLILIILFIDYKINAKLIELDNLDIKIDNLEKEKANILKCIDEKKLKKK